MPKTRIAREVDEILASTKTRQGSVNDQRGAEAFRNIQHEARAAESEANMADNARAVAAHNSPQYAHSLVEQSKMHADQASRFVEIARAWVREAQGTPQFDSVERVLANVRSTAARAKLRATVTQKAFEKRFGKFDPRGVRDHATVKKTKGVPTMGEEDYKIIGLLKKARLEGDKALATMCDIALQADEDNPAVQAAVAYCKRVLKA